MVRMLLVIAAVASAPLLLLAIFVPHLFPRSLVPSIAFLALAWIIIWCFDYSGRRRSAALHDRLDDALADLKRLQSSDLSEESHLKSLSSGAPEIEKRTIH